MPERPFERASSTGSTKQADSWPRGRPAFISVGELGIHTRVAISSKTVSASPSTALSEAPYVLSGAAIVRATRPKRSSGPSTGRPASSLTRYRRSRTVTALGLKASEPLEAEAVIRAHPSRRDGDRPENVEEQGRNARRRGQDAQKRRPVRDLQICTSQTCPRQREHPAAVSLRLRHIVLPRGPDALAQCVVHRPRHSRRYADQHGARGNDQSLWHYRTCGHHAPRTNVHPVQEHAPHADQTVVIHPATVKNDSVADPHARTDGRGDTLVHVDYRAVLHVRRFPDHNGGGIPAEHGLVPDAGARAQGDVAEHHRTGRDERRRVNVDYWVTGLGTNGHCTQA